MNVSFKLDGLDQVRAALASYGPRALQSATDHLHYEAELIMTDSKRNYVPVDEGILRASGHVEPPVVDGGNVFVRLVYGGLAKAYAIIQHERLDFRHPVGGAKYLELPLLAAAKGLARRIAAYVRGQLGG